MFLKQVFSDVFIVKVICEVRENLNIADINKSIIYITFDLKGSELIGSGVEPNISIELTAFNIFL